MKGAHHISYFSSIVVSDPYMDRGHLSSVRRFPISKEPLELLIELIHMILFFTRISLFADDFFVSVDIWVEII